MLSHLRRFFIVNMAIVLALVGSGVLQPSQVQAASVLPNMIVTLQSGSSSYMSTTYAGTSLTFQALVNNVGNVPLQVIANLTAPANWDVNDKYNNCPTNLAVGSVCTFTWVFTPQVSGQVYLRVYVRGYYTDSTGNANRITQSPAFLFNVLPTWQVQSVVNGTTVTTTSLVPPPLLFPSMNVTLIADNLYTYSETVHTGKVVIFRAQVENSTDVPLQVVANLTVPTGWGVSQDKYSDCPSTASLGHKDTCTISWYFNPLVSGQVFLRVYVRGYYTDSYGNTQRITQSPAFIFNVVP